MAKSKLNRPTDWHLKMFVEFCREEIASGGPDPHMRMAEDLALATNDPLWAAGAYTAPYVVSTTTALVRRFRRSRAVEQESALAEFIRSQWANLPIRKERRVNGTGPEKLAEIMSRYGHWLDQGGIEKLKGLDFHATFKELDPPHYGRYFKTKLYEVLRRTLLAMSHPVQLPEMTDIIPKGGSHPRGGLRYLYPGHDPKDDSPAGLAEANRLAGELKGKLLERGVDVDWFVLEVLLCNYRQAVNGGQYPGRAHDSELGHYYTVLSRFPDVEKVADCRSRLFDPRYLGEVGDRWSGRRVELGSTMGTYDYVWADRKYDYQLTKDLSRPAPRGVRCT